MMRAQLFDTHSGADKRQTVRRKDERVRREVGKRRKRIEKPRQRVAVGSTGQTLTLVLILGRSISPDMHPFIDLQ